MRAPLLCQGRLTPHGCRRRGCTPAAAAPCCNAPSLDKLFRRLLPLLQMSREGGEGQQYVVCKAPPLQPANLPGAPCSPLLLQRNLPAPLTNSLAQLIKDGIQAAAHARAAKHALLGGSTGRVHRRSEGRLAPTVHQLNEGKKAAAA